MFSGVDLIILVIIAISVVISTMRGFFKEAINLITWVTAILITLMFTSRFSSLIPRDVIEHPQARYAISAAVLFFCTMLIGGLINFLLQRLLRATNKSWIDFWLGVVFGFARGFVVVTVIVLLANLSPSVKQATWWNQSAIIPTMQKSAKFLHAQLPRELAQHFDFS